MSKNLERLSEVLLLIGTLHAAGCTAIISGVYVVHELITAESYTVTFQVGAAADDVYANLVEYARQKNRRNLPIVKDDATNRQFEAGNRSDYWAWKVWPVEGGSQVTFSATLRDKSVDETREIVREVLGEFFEKYRLEYTYVD